MSTSELEANHDAALELTPGETQDGGVRKRLEHGRSSAGDRQRAAYKLSGDVVEQQRRTAYTAGDRPRQSFH